MVNIAINDKAAVVAVKGDHLPFQAGATPSGTTATTLVEQLRWEKLVSVTADYTATNEDGIIEVDATAGPVIVTLPTLASAKSGVFSQKIRISKRDASVNTVTVKGSGTETINGVNTLVISAQYTTEIPAAGATEWIRS